MIRQISKAYQVGQTRPQPQPKPQPQQVNSTLTEVSIERDNCATRKLLAGSSHRDMQRVLGILFDPTFGSLLEQELFFKPPFLRPLSSRSWRRSAIQDVCRPCPTLRGLTINWILTKSWDRPTHGGSRETSARTAWQLSNDNKIKNQSVLHITSRCSTDTGSPHVPFLLGEQWRSRGGTVIRVFMRMCKFQIQSKSSDSVRHFINTYMMSSASNCEAAYTCARGSVPN